MDLFILTLTANQKRPASISSQKLANRAALLAHQMWQANGMSLCTHEGSSPNGYVGGDSSP